MKTLMNQIKYEPLWSSYVACLKAISDYYSMGHSTAWIYGACGHAFIMNISSDICPSGPTAFSDRPMAALFKNLGISLQGTIFDKNDPEFTTKQKAAWEIACKAIDNDLPTFGWEMGIPEYSIIYGYDDTNYLFYDQHGQPQSKQWDTLGKTDIGVVSIFSANQEDKVAGLHKILKDTFNFTLEFSKHKAEWTYPLYSNGLKAYDVWIAALETGKYNPFGLAYNSAVWAESRAMALEFLKEAAVMLNSSALDNLMEHYDIINWSLQKVAKLFPMPPRKAEFDEETIESAVDNLFLAKEAEKAALNEMKPVLSQL